MWQVQQLAEVAASRKEDKICMSGQPVFFEPIAVETLGVFNSSADSLLKEIGSKISLNT